MHMSLEVTVENPVSLMPSNHILQHQEVTHRTLTVITFCTKDNVIKKCILVVDISVDGALALCCLRTVNALFLNVKVSLLLCLLQNQTFILVYMYLQGLGWS